MPHPPPEKSRVIYAVGRGLITFKLMIRNLSGRDGSSLLALTTLPLSTICLSLPLSLSLPVHLTLYLGSISLSLSLHPPFLLPSLSPFFPLSPVHPPPVLSLYLYQLKKKNLNKSDKKGQEETLNLTNAFEWGKELNRE